MLALAIVVSPKFKKDQDLALKSPVPDFAAIKNVSNKKQTFFNYFKPIVAHENARIARERERLAELSVKKVRTRADKEWLEALAVNYGLELEAPYKKEDFDKLFRRVDIIPSSLVLAQAAIESGWGSSRFAREGFNYFGLWCFSKGCGMLPASRDNGARHEVQVFPSPQASVRAYLNNLNRHPAYRSVRNYRYQARTKQTPVYGCQLARGLERYSSRGLDYVNEVLQFIRVNKLSRSHNAPCQRIKIETVSTS